MTTQELIWTETDAPALPTSARPAAPVIEVAHLHKEYGTTVAVDEASFTVHAGEFFGILGRNGAGKTTTVECITGLRTPDRGEITVLGLDPRRDRHELHERVGVQLQHSAVPDLMRMRSQRAPSSARAHRRRIRVLGTAVAPKAATDATPETRACA